MAVLHPLIIPDNNNDDNINKKNINDNNSNNNDKNNNNNDDDDDNESESEEASLRSSLLSAADQSFFSSSVIGKTKTTTGYRKNTNTNTMENFAAAVSAHASDAYVVRLPASSRPLREGSAEDMDALGYTVVPVCTVDPRTPLTMHIAVETELSTAGMLRTYNNTFVCGCVCVGVFVCVCVCLCVYVFCVCVCVCRFASFLSSRPCALMCVCSHSLTHSLRFVRGCCVCGVCVGCVCVWLFFLFFLSGRSAECGVRVRRPDHSPSPRLDACGFRYRYGSWWW